MTRVDFYFNAGDKVEVARKLAIKAWQAGQCALLYTRDPAQAGALDSGLWTFAQLSFIPHVRCGHPLARQTPVLIGESADEMTSADVLINLSGEQPPFFSRFDRLLEVVTEDPEDRQAARDRYRFYKERGYELQTHDLK